MAPTPTPTPTPTPATPTPPAQATPTPKAKPTPTPTPGAKPAYESTITPAGGANANADLDTDVNTQKRWRLWDVLTRNNGLFKDRTDLPKISDLNKVSPFSLNLLNNLACVPNKSGVLSVFNPDGTKPIFDMTPGGAVGIRKNWDLNDKTQLTSTDHIDALLKGSAVAKMSMGEAGASLSTPNDQSRAMMEKAAQLAHLKIDNPKYGKPEDLEAALKAIDPNLSAKMTSQWNAMKGESILKPIVQPTPAATTPTPTPTPGTATPTPGAAAPKTALAVTADNIKTLETAGKPVVLMVYDAHATDARVKEDAAKIDALAAAAGPGVIVAKMSLDDVHNLKDNLKPDDPLRQLLDKDQTAIAIGADGKILTYRNPPPDNMQKWSKDALGADAFPTPTPAASTPTPVAPNPSLAPGQR